MGNNIIPENRVRYAIAKAGNNAAQLRRLLEVAMGTAWDDELEPYRYAGAGAPLRMLKRVG